VGDDSRYRYCPSCGTEYRPEFKECRECGLPLVDEPPAPADHDHPSLPIDASEASDAVPVYAADRHLAEIVRSFLEDNGVPAITSGEGYSSAYPLTVGQLGERRVLVRRQDVDEAHSLLEEAEESLTGMAGDATSIDTIETSSSRPHVMTFERLRDWVAPIAIVMIVLWLFFAGPL
jgi:hypothetical protein